MKKILVDTKKEGTIQQRAKEGKMMTRSKNISFRTPKKKKADGESSAPLSLEKSF